MLLILVLWLHASVQESDLVNAVHLVWSTYCHKWPWLATRKESEESENLVDDGVTDVSKAQTTNAVVVNTGESVKEPVADTTEVPPAEAAGDKTVELVEEPVADTGRRQPLTPRD